MHNAEYFHISSINFYILFNNLVILFILHQMSNIVFAKNRDLHCSEVFNWIDQILIFYLNISTMHTIHEAQMCSW